MRKYLLIIVVFLTIIPAFSQISSSEIVVELHKPPNADKKSSRVFSDIAPWWRLTKIDSFTGIPVDVSSYSIYSLVVNENQATYESLKLGKITRIQYDQYIAKNKVDTTFIDPDFKAINKLNYCVGLNHNKSAKYVIFDENNNNDFSDDKRYTFFRNPKTSKFEGENIPISIRTSYYDGAFTRPTTVELNVAPNPSAVLIDPSPSMREVYDPENSVSIVKWQYMQGQFTINNTVVSIQAYNNNDHTNHVPDIVAANPSLAVIDSCHSIIPWHGKIGDTILVANRKIYLSKIEKNNLHLVNLGVLVDSSSLGSAVPLLNSLSIADNSVVNLNELMKDKYVLLDFWGSWCNPCINSLPRLVELYDKVKDRSDVVIIGVATEDHADLSILREKILSHNVLWQNVWNRMTEVKSLYSPQCKLRITNFPSYVIVDKSGKIVFTTNDPACERDKAVEFFMDLIK